MISERLKRVREELGLTQQGLADRLGVSLRTQQNYEAGKRAPDADYLAAIAAAGADVLYILTGQRAGGLPPMTMSQSTGAQTGAAMSQSMGAGNLRPDQVALLDNYEHSDEVARQAAQRLLDPRSQRKKA